MRHFRVFTFMLVPILTLAVVQLAAAEPTAGPIVGPDHHLYQTVEIYLPWHDARNYCFAQGGHLVTLNSQEENDFVYQLLDWGWLGGTDEALEGAWTWVSGEPWSFTNWAPGEPNNCAGGSPCEPEHYLSFKTGHLGQWNDEPDGGHKYFICEWDVLIGPDYHLYQMTPIYLTWHDARDYCFAQDGHLVTLNSQEENDFVYQLLDWGWLGGTDEALEGAWTWVSGEPWSYTNWAPGEPNNCAGGSPCVPEHFLSFRTGYPGQWNDEPEGGHKHFICEWETIDIKPGSYPNSINLGANGVLPVAILTSDALDATAVDPVTAVLAGASPLRWAVEDVDYDGDLDLLFIFRIAELDLTAGSTNATLTGETFGGQPFMAADTVRIVPADS